MRRRSRVVAAAVGVLLLAGGALAARPVALPALGFVAKTVCSDVFVGGFTAEQALADLPDEPVARLVRTSVDEERRVVHASVPLLARRSARFRSGLGCTLVSGDTSALPALARAVTGLPRPDTAAAWTAVDSTRATVSGAIEAVLDAAFLEPAAGAQRRTRAVVIVHDGQIVGERYASGFDAGSRFTGWSMTKSVTNALVGILVGQGRLDLGANALLPEWSAADDPRRDITLHHLMQMSSGLGFDENYSPTGGATRMLFSEHDAAAVAAASPLVAEPGTRFHYSSGTTNIISALMRSAVGSDSAHVTLPRHALFDRIGMHSAVIEPDPSGTLVGSSFMYATARDWARFGMLFLDDGVWNGERILPEGWVAYSTAPAAAADGAYGAQWWLNAGTATDSTRRTWPAVPRDAYFASGFQGQYIVILPRHRLVIVRLGVTPDLRAAGMEQLITGAMAALEGAQL
jgi:CubicO group peptidase (beta-lactamase class C family)